MQMQIESYVIGRGEHVELRLRELVFCIGQGALSILYPVLDTF